MRIIGLGAGGHAGVVLDAIRRGAEHEVVGLVERPGSEIGRLVGGVEVIATDQELDRLRASGVAGFFLGVGSVCDAGPRIRLYELGRAAGMIPVTVVDPAAICSPSATLGEGTVVLAGAVVNAGARIGGNVIINTGAIVEHGTTVEDHVHVATGARLGGDVHVARGAHVGIGATVLQGVRIGSRAVVGAGAVVVRNVAEGAVVVGVPAAPIERR